MPTEEEIRIGDFSKPLAPPVKGRSPAGEKLDGVEAKLESEVEQAEKNLKPLESYEEKLKKIGISREKAASVVDAILTRGFWSDALPVTSRIKVTFRTRLYRDTKRLHQYLEVVRPTFETAYGEIVAKHMLAASLEGFGKDQFTHPGRAAVEKDIEDAFEQRLNYVESLPDVTYHLLYKKLVKFDETVMTCMEEGAVENF